MSGQKIGQQILKDFPKKGDIDAIFTVNDGGGLNVVEALADAGREEIFVATIDGDPKSVDNIKNKRLTRIDSAQFCGPLGAEAMRLAYEILQGKPVLRILKYPRFLLLKKHYLFTQAGWGPFQKNLLNHGKVMKKHGLDL
jgi:ribose transport system substrate-binding protein